MVYLFFWRISIIFPPCISPVLSSLHGSAYENNLDNKKAIAINTMFLQLICSYVAFYFLGLDFTYSLGQIDSNCQYNPLNF